MRLSIAAVTTLAASLAEDLAGYAAAGADGIGLYEAKLDGDPSAAERIRASGLAVTYCLPSCPSLLPLGPPWDAPAAPDQRVERLCTSVRRLAPLRPVLVYAAIGPVGARDPGATRQALREGVAAFARAGAEAGVRVALEAPGRTGVADLLALIDEAGAPGVDLLLDVTQLVSHPHEETAQEQIQRATGRIAGVQVSDLTGPPGAAVRTVPGEGRLDLAALLDAVERTGYRGWYEIEVPTLAPGAPLWGVPAAEAARRVVDGLSRAWPPAARATG